ncbi:aminotransferase class I/II-fold pyridoxal phosphate-dependent enzyme [Cyanobacterium sp. IPPAS B-1200]|uniref:aminotransferase class I/II-fold pyridoxal phosphate-dependent enzyme n=1 Tax=Cyanobacterium sp. IPPAS B-1200 TaxID=1562720 RepID=UPI0009F648D8|nr:aminotransferase class I/II-fold pyridoxal phosphate-dependent enzyme [Cyanobacterium sp. IPPAS B-1200]
MNNPLLNQLKKSSQKHHAPFYAPGHKQGKGASTKLKEIFGELVFKADLPELPELDNLFAPEGVIKEAQEFASHTFGAKKTWFLTNGSTCGIIASILATCREGDRIILPRNVHQSVIYGLVLSGAIPLFINPKYDENFDICYGLSPQQIEIALQRNNDVKAVMIVSPTYHGVCSNIKEIAEITHRHNIPLLVDEAHGAHFTFHPQLPSSALASGADVVIQSTHKVLGALTQASMLHIQGDLVNGDGISNALQLLQSSSPSYLLLASLESATTQMAEEGKELLDKTIYLATMARKAIRNLDYFQVLDFEKATPYFDNLDITRLTVNVSKLGITGYLADEIFHEKLAVTCELPSLKNLTFIISIGNDDADIDLLINGFKKLTDFYQEVSEISSNYGYLNFDSKFSISSRQAYWAGKKVVPLEDSLNKISGETISAYPPGIPILIAGEKITIEALDYLKKVVMSGATITGAMDSRLNTIKIVN